MTLSRKAFEVVWRIAVLTLPWQTRLFWDANLVGWPWEQGRVSIYVSWLPLLVTIILGLFQPKRALPLALRRNLFWLIAALGACTVVAAPSPATAAMQWWIQIMLLAAFGITLLRAQVQSRKVAFWFVISLVPHAILAIIQFASQTVWASKWLGMATQIPANLGVSVVQTSTGRFLRAYGGFPHPNILGGWMAVGLIVALTLYPSSTRAGEGDMKSPFRLHWWEKGVWGIEGLFTLALFYSFSRSAWLAAAVGLVAFLVMSLRGRSTTRPQRQALALAGAAPDVAIYDRKQSLLSFALPIILFVALAIIHRDLVFTRLDVSASRLEQKSVVTRIQTLKDGIEIYRAVPLFGSGPNSELPVLASIKKIERSPSPLEPPHMVWLLILANFGTVGALFIFGFALFIMRQILSRWTGLSLSDRSLLLSLVACQLIVYCLDHYPWSLWPGQVLSFILLYLIFDVLDGPGSKERFLDA